MKCKESVAKNLLQRYLCTMTDQPTSTPGTRDLDIESLKALSHPLRVRLFNELSIHGAATASKLADRVGESSGSTSYHLRQLERHGFVREVEGRGTARERWWERVPGSINLSPPKTTATPSGREATILVSREFARLKAQTLETFVERGLDTLPRPWYDASTVSQSSLQLTLEQLTELSEAAETFVSEYIDRFRGQDLPESRAVQVQLNIIPVIDIPVTDIPVIDIPHIDIER
jgi:DNA-binding transcriptional ArsR family regulator